MLIDPRGEILLVHRKINELDIAHDLYAIGDRLAVAHTELGTLGVSICADNFPNSLAIGHVLARMGAQLLLSPSAWAVDADYDHAAVPYGERWRRAYGELGRLYDLPVIGVSNVGWLTDGPWKGRRAIGCSLATNHRGEILAEGPFGEAAKAVLVVEVEPRSPRRHRHENRRRPSRPRLRRPVSAVADVVSYFALCPMQYTRDAVRMSNFPWQIASVDKHSSSSTLVRSTWNSRPAVSTYVLPFSSRQNSLPL